MRYYSTQRPISLGSYPKPSSNKVLNIHNYPEKSYVEEIGREAWGYIDYEHPLQETECKDYGFSLPLCNFLRCQYAEADSRSHNKVF